MNDERLKQIAEAERDEALDALQAALTSDTAYARMVSAEAEAAAWKADAAVAHLRVLELVGALVETRRLVSEASASGFVDEDAARALFVNNGAITRALKPPSPGIREKL